MLGLFECRFIPQIQHLYQVGHSFLHNGQTHRSIVHGIERLLQIEALPSYDPGSLGSLCSLAHPCRPRCHFGSLGNLVCTGSFSPTAISKPSLDDRPPRVFHISRQRNCGSSDGVEMLLLGSDVSELVCEDHVPQLGKDRESNRKVRTSSPTVEIVMSTSRGPQRNSSVEESRSCSLVYPQTRL